MLICGNQECKNYDVAKADHCRDWYTNLPRNCGFKEGIMTQMMKERNETIAALTKVIGLHLGTDDATEKVMELADLLETTGKLMLPLHHVKVEIEVLPR